MLYHPIINSPQRVNGNGSTPPAGDRLLFVRTFRRRNKSSRRHFRNGQRAAALRAITAGRLYIAGSAPTLATAAACCGSNVVYLRAALVLLKHDDNVLFNAVLGGMVSILDAAREVRPVVELREAYRAAGYTDRVNWARREGVETIFNDAIAPAIA
jgi:hypothetical protein